MSLAWDLPLSATKKLVLLAMCDWANDSGFCFPSMATVASRTCISKRQCQRIMGELIADALIEVTGNQQGGFGSRRYQINLAVMREGVSAGTGDKLSPVANAASLPVTTVLKTNDTDVTRTNSNHQLDPPLQQQAGQSIDWTYLSQLETAERVVVINLLNRLDAALHQDVIDELAGALRAKAIKTQWPGWLRGLVQRARGGAFVPHHALAIKQDRLRIVREVTEAEKRRLEEERRRDPAARARGCEAMNAAIAVLTGATTTRGGVP